MDVQAVFSIDALQIRYPGGKTLGPFTCQCGAGPIGLLGANGAGKTSFLGMIAGTLGSESGSFYFRGQAIEPRHRSWKARIGYVSEEPVFNEYLSIRDNLLYQALLHKIDPEKAEKRIHSLLELLDLTENADLPVINGSQGMRKKTQWGMALIHNPDLLILDEAFTSLDAAALGRLVHLLAGLETGGTSILLSTHLLPMARILCSQLLVLREGRVIDQQKIPERDASGLEDYQLFGLDPLEERKKAEAVLTCLEN